MPSPQPSSRSGFGRDNPPAPISTQGNDDPRQFTSSTSSNVHPTHSEEPQNPYEPRTNATEPEPRRHSLTKKVLGALPGRKPSVASNTRRKSTQGHHVLGDCSMTAQMHQDGDDKQTNGVAQPPRTGAMPRPVGGTEKLGTFSGVFVPTSLNVLSILMFIRFGFLIGQGGVLGVMGMLIASYLINLVTTLSISAIATNGTVRGGGAYYLISRSLGPEFGGSIGIVLYLGFVFNTGLNAVGLVDCLVQNFGDRSGNWYNWMPEEFWYAYLWATIILLVCTAICLAGSSLFARASNGLLAILLLATFSIPLSALIVSPFKSRALSLEYTGLSSKTFAGNLMPRLTTGAAGSVLPGRENFQDLFGILFPATGGIFAGASMSGDLKHPSKAIPKGTLGGLWLTFFAYVLVVLAMAATITRESFYKNLNVIQDINMSAVLILLGEFATTFFSTLMGVIGSAKLLQALARDDLLPGFSIFAQGTKKGDEPTYAIIITYLVAQLTMLCDINQIASFVTMTYLMTFLVTNLACFLLKLSSAPNFRPSFHYFNIYTAGAGTIISGAMMFFVDGLYATGCVGILVVIFLIIHYTTPPKSWGDVSQSLIYHQVRKYLLRLRQEHVKFWRPQIILFVNDPRRQYKLIQFCNSLKKGALYILGHVIVSEDFGAAVPEARRQQAAWTKYIDFSKVKAFVNIAISPGVEWGTRNIVLGSGLGGMRPNIAVLGFYNLTELRQRQPLVDLPDFQGDCSTTAREGEETDPTANLATSPSLQRRKSFANKRVEGTLPTDICRAEGSIGVKSYLSILEDLLLRVQINVAVAKGFEDLELPDPKGPNSKKYIDLWPIQMSAEIASAEGDPNVLTTNFDTYTLILQLGVIINTVPAWRKSYKLRVAVFVEYESDVEEERQRVKVLLENLRIQAEVLVFWLACGDLKTYEYIVNGAAPKGPPWVADDVDKDLEDEDWWQEIQKVRGNRNVTASEALADLSNDSPADHKWPSPSFQQGRNDSNQDRLEGLKKLINKQRLRHSMRGISKLGVNLGMRTHRLHPQLVHHHAAHGSASEDSESSDTNTIDEDEFDPEYDASSLSQLSAVTDTTVDKSKTSISQMKRSRSAGDNIAGSVPVRDMATKGSSHRTIPPSADMSKPQTHAHAAKPTSSSPEGQPETISQPPTLPSSATPSKNATLSRLKADRPQTIRQPSMGKFSSKPLPQTKVSTEDGPGPSIMFAESSSPSKQPRAPPTTQQTTTADNKADPHAPAQPASGYPFPNAVPLGFNDLPCRAQHLILNELVRRHSPDTAVVFTTLPSPIEGTSKSVEDSVAYLSDLEVLCRELPPVLLVHSNSLTVTMNL
ncbi:MAG: hypothetical protein M1833_005861 [Piccolia ochrophora]|nr:MAG: hypothetical protein M1833_005861 [Piccolia ochrophora]